MRSCIILGSGRSGTSMVAGCLAASGYFMGDSLLAGTDGNPKGYYEDREVNAINEALLAPIVPRRPRLLGRWFFRHRPRRNQRWLARLPLRAPSVTASSCLHRRMETLTARRPFCFKDPRFSYTLEAWRPLLADASYVCVFRHPAATAESILKECAREPYLRSLRLSFRQAVEVWTLMYLHILKRHAELGDWLFLHYDQVLEGDGLRRLGGFLETAVDLSFPDRELRRSGDSRPVAAAAGELYRQLCLRAEYPVAEDR